MSKLMCGIILVSAMLLAGCATTSPSPVASTAPFVGTWRAPALAEMRGEGVDYFMFYVSEDGTFIGSAHGFDREIVMGFTGRWTAESATTASVIFEGEGGPGTGRVTLIDSDTLLAVADNEALQFTRQ